MDTVDFSRIQTYFLPDSVYPIKTEDDTTTYEQNPYTDQIISTIAENMSSYGYQRITEPDTNNLPDVIVYASSLVSTTVSVWYPYYPGWDWWWGYPGWGYYPPYYPPYYGGYPYVSSYTMGTLKITMLDPWNPIVIEGDTVIPSYWSATINGLLQGNQIEERIERNIDKSFELSPYLKEGK
jgi:hypothetical protein